MGDKGTLAECLRLRERATRAEAEVERLRAALTNAAAVFRRIGLPVYADACDDACEGDPYRALTSCEFCGEPMDIPSDHRGCVQEYDRSTNPNG